MKKKQLSQVEFFKVCQFVLDNKQTIESDQMNKTDLGRFISNNLPFFSQGYRGVNNVLEALGEEAPQLTSPGTDSEDRKLRTVQHNLYKCRRAIRLIAESLDKDLLDQVNSIFSGRTNPNDND